MQRKIFINLPVKNLEKTKAFFTGLGFTFNPQFTDQNAACLVISDTIFAMLMNEKTFTGFTGKEIPNLTKVSEVINAINLGSRKEVDEMANKALTIGGHITREPEDLGWMYSRSFQDIDGHLWEVFFMDESKIPAPGK